MLKYLLRGLQAAVAVEKLDDLRRISARLLRIEATKHYLRGVRVARLSALGLICVVLLTGLIGLGVLLLHAALFCLLPWSLKHKAVLALILGLGYVVAGSFALARAMKEKTWIEKSGAADMLEKIRPTSP